jgi:hypothetical protein
MSKYSEKTEKNKDSTESKQEKAPRIYVGSGKKVKGHSIINVYLNIEKAIIEAEKLGCLHKNKQGEECIRISVLEKKEEDEFGNTHSICLDTYVNEKG